MQLNYKGLTKKMAIKIDPVPTHNRSCKSIKKISDEQVDEMRIESWECYNKRVPIPYKKFVDLYKVSKETIRNAIHGGGSYTKTSY